MHSISINRRLRARAAGVFACSLLGGCYLLQSAAGQLGVMSERKPIAGVIANPATPPEVRRQLEAVAQIRDFATRDLGLPDNGSYRSYADVGRRYVVWNVVAAPEFSVDPKEWCYPVVGCVAYRGYFVEHRARRFADELRGRGLDVTVDGVAAYSTLGHFDDPILSTMLGWSDVELASIVFHELTHQMIYVANDADFNEALATTVEEEGVRRWLRSLGRDRDLEDYLSYQKRFTTVVALLTGARAQLRTLYSSGVDHERMRREKAAVFAGLRQRYSILEEQWGGHAPFGSWFEDDINNANLASIATYYDCVPGFRRELEAAGGDLQAFYARVRRLSKLDQRQRDALVCGAR